VQDKSEGRKMSNVTIDDVAALAKVSIKTVSRVVNQEYGVRQSTREKVLDAIAQLNYRPNTSARSLAGNRSFVLGLLYGNPSATYVIDVQVGVLSTCRPQGYDLLIHPCDYTDKNISIEIVDLIHQKRIDGVILTPPLTDHLPVLDALKKINLPFVRIAPTLNRELSSYVITNDHQAAYDMTCQLIALGHVKIGFICGHSDHRAMAHRFEGYKAALSNNGIKFNADWVETGLNSFESGEISAQKLLQKKSRPTAIFAANDDMAAAVIMVAHQQGIKMPADLSVAGFDDTPVAHQIWPTLSTVRQPIQQMARKATELLLAQLKGKAVPLSASCLDSTLIMRDSVGLAAQPVAGDTPAGAS
jgi:LacI family transcriptional regulator